MNKVVRFASLPFIMAVLGLCFSVVPVQAAVDSWMTKADLPTARQFVSVAAANGKVYAIGGGLLTNYSDSVDEVDAYDPDTNTWSKVAHLLHPRYAPATVTVNNKIYVISGRPGGDQTVNDKSVEVYDPTTNAWSTVADIPIGVTYPAAAVANGKIYVFGGNNTNGNIGQTYVQEYDPATNVWTAKANMPTARYAMGAATVNGIIYVIGGVIQNAATNEVEAYNPSTDTWTAKASLPKNIDALGVSAVGGKIYCIGGRENGYGAYLNTNYEYDPATNTWATKASMSVARDTTTAVLNEKIYAVGSLNSTGVSSTVEVYTPDISPFIETNNMSHISATTAVAKLSVSNIGSLNVTQHGHVWSTSPNPTISLATKSTLGSMQLTSSVTSYPIFNLSPGTKYYIRAYVTTDAGTTYGDELVFTTLGDSTPPAVPAGLTGVPDLANIKLSWNAVSDSDLASYKIYINGVYWATVDKSAISYNVTGLTSSTSYQIQVSSVDTNGNESAKSSILSVSTLTPDTTPPVITVAPYNTAPTNQDVVVTVATNEGTLNAVSHTFTENGSYTFRAVDAAGNVSEKTVTITNIDKTAPTTTDNAPTGWVTQDAVVNLSASDGGSGVASTFYTVDDGAVQTGNSVTLSTDGIHSLVYWSIDQAGNMEVKRTATVKIDKTPPASSAVISPAAPNGSNGWYTSNVTLSLSASDSLSGLMKTEYQINNGEWTPYNGSIPSFGDGIYKVNYRSTDNAGNIEPVKTIEFKIDTTAPTLTVQLDKTVLWPPNHKMVTIHATLNPNDDLAGIRSVILTSITSNEPDGQEDIEANIGTSDTSFSLRAERLGTGSGRVYTITYTVTDNAGNTSTAVCTVSVPHNQ
jgi:N-acetylneuraminic acid mutarotase